MLLKDIILPALWDTLYMVCISTLISIFIGFVLAIILVITEDNGLNPNKTIYSILDFVINILRSFPFIILMVAIAPLTRLIAGTRIGTTAAIVPLTIAAAPFTARVIQSALKEVDSGIIEAAKSIGASTKQIIFKVMIKEAFPSIILGVTLTIINLIGYSAMAGAIGGGGLGDIAIKYGYYRWKTDILIYTIIVLIVLVQALQQIGNLIYKKLNR